MSNSKTLYVSPKGMLWQVKGAGMAKPIKLVSSQAEAIAIAQRTAAANPGYRIAVQNQSGQFCRIADTSTALACQPALASSAHRLARTTLIASAEAGVEAGLLALVVGFGRAVASNRVATVGWDAVAEDVVVDAGKAATQSALSEALLACQLGGLDRHVYSTALVRKMAMVSEVTAEVVVESAIDVAGMTRGEIRGGQVAKNMVVHSTRAILGTAAAETAWHVFRDAPPLLRLLAMVAAKYGGGKVGQHLGRRLVGA